MTLSTRPVWPGNYRLIITSVSSVVFYSSLYSSTQPTHVCLFLLHLHISVIIGVFKIMTYTDGLGEIQNLLI